jgi:hypothetical protein
VQIAPGANFDGDSIPNGSEMGSYLDGSLPPAKNAPIAHLGTEVIQVIEIGLRSKGRSKIVAIPSSLSINLGD